MSRHHRRFAATLVYTLAAALLWLALGAGAAPRAVARAERSERVERAHPADQLAPSTSARPRRG